MSKIIVCSMSLFNHKELLQQIGIPKQAGKSALLNIFHALHDTSEQLILTTHQRINLQFGDKITCSSGLVMVVLNTSTSVRNFFLCPNLPLRSLPNIEKFKVVLEINEETTKSLPVGIKTNLLPSENIRRYGGGYQN